MRTIILLDFFILVIVFIFKLYSLVDRNYIFSIYGGKLEKYIANDNLQNTACSLGKSKDNVFSQILKSIFKPPKYEIIKDYLIISVISVTVIFIKTGFSFSFFTSNFIFIKVFQKNIDLNLLLGSNIVFFKSFYFILYSFCIFTITSDIYFKVYLKLKQAKQDKKRNLVKYEFPYITLKSTQSKVIIQKYGLYQNILITGSIGSGKTSCTISNIFLEFLHLQMSGLIIDVKGNYIETIKSMLNENTYNKRIVEISLDSNFKYNPLKSSVSNFELANRLKQILLVLSSKNTSDAYWLDKAESYIRDFLTIMHEYTDTMSFYELHMLVIDKEYLYDKLEIVKNKILDNCFSDDELFNISQAIRNIKNEYLKLDERTIAIIKSEITRITSVFVADKKIYDAFCTSNNTLNFDENKIYVLSLNIGKNKQLAKIISTYLKLEFQSQILSKIRNSPIFFVCDEYQEIANEQDANFFSLSREYKCINVVSMQSYSSLINALNNETASKVIIQNLVNKIWFRNDDVYTVIEITKQIGKEIRSYETINYQESSQDSKYNIISNNFKNYKSGLSKSVSISKKPEYLLTEEYFTTSLNTFEAAMMITDGQKMKFIPRIKLKRWDEDF